MRPFFALGAAVLALAGASCAAAHAADLAPLDYASAPAYGPEAPLEFGTGWYLRGDASFGPDEHPALDAGGFRTTKQDWNYVLGGGAGYRFNSFLRVDATGDYFAPNDYHPADLSDPTVTNRATLQKFDALANLYIDLGSWYGLTPYVGGGAGVAIFDPSEHIAVADPALYAGDRTASRTQFAWAAMAGVGYQVDPSIVVDLGYRHIDLGRFSTTLAGYAIDHRYTQDEVRIGLRYMIN